MAALTAEAIHPAVAATAKPLSHARTKETAREFESVYLQGMLEEMFADVEEGGPFDDGEGAKIWRSLRTEEFARAVARAGGIGLAEHVERHMISLQETQS